MDKRNLGQVLASNINHRGDRVAGQADERNGIDLTERKRASRLDGEAPEMELAERFDRSLEVIFVADRDAT